jgi:hypothetical protein
MKNQSAYMFFNVLHRNTHTLFSLILLNVPNLCVSTVLQPQKSVFEPQIYGEIPKKSKNSMDHHVSIAQILWEVQPPPGSDRLPHGHDGATASAGSAGSSEVETSAPSEAQAAAFRLREQQLLSELVESRREVEKLGMA